MQNNTSFLHAIKNGWVIVSIIILSMLCVGFGMILARSMQPTEPLIPNRIINAIGKLQLGMTMDEVEQSLCLPNLIPTDEKTKNVWNCGKDETIWVYRSWLSESKTPPIFSIDDFYIMFDNNKKLSACYYVSTDQCHTLLLGKNRIEMLINKLKTLDILGQKQALSTLKSYIRHLGTFSFEKDTPENIESQIKIIEQWWQQNKDSIYWQRYRYGGNLLIDQESKAVGIPTDEYRKTHPWPKEDKPKEPDKPK